MTKQEFQALAVGTKVRKTSNGKLYAVHNPDIGYIVALKNGKPWGRLWFIRDFSDIEKV